MLEPLLAIDRPRKGDLLDVGCGFGFVPHFWNHMGYGDAVGLETSLYGVVGREKLGTNIIHKYYNDAEPIRGRKFDYVFSSEVLEHVPDPKAFLDEIGQGLAEDGILILTTPSAQAVRSDMEYTTLIATLSPGFHFFIASADALTTLLKEARYPHVLVRDSGTRLFAWASHQPLPKIADGFNDWSIYMDYLDGLAAHDDTHIAGGAMYRLFKDSLNLGEMERAAAIYPRFEALARDGYGLDCTNIRLSDSMRRAREGRDNATFPSWMGCSFYFAGLYHQRTGGDLHMQHDLFAAAVFTRENVGYDFGMWADILRSFPQIWRAKRLIIANDSVLVIPPMFPALMDRVRASDSDFIAMTEGSMPNYHAQSYFVVLQNQALKNNDILAFWKNVTDLSDKTKVIEAYELRLTEVIRQSGGLKIEVFFDRAALFGEDASKEISNWNPSHFFWERLLDRGFHFIKLELLRDNPMKIQLATAFAQLEIYGADVSRMREHIARSKKERAHLKREEELNAPKSAYGVMATLREIDRTRLRMRRLRQGR